jgi:hypothetical protein
VGNNPQNTPQSPVLRDCIAENVLYAISLSDRKIPLDKSGVIHKITGNV